MKKVYFLSFIILFFPLITTASFDKNLYYGLQKNTQVKELQQFLIDGGYLSGSATGNYFSLTVAAVKKLQTINNISPVTGYFGPKTRTVVNSLLSQATPTSSKEAPKSSNAGQVTPVANNDISTTQDQIALLQKQLMALNAQQTATNQQLQQQTQTIRQITPKPPQNTIPSSPVAPTDSAKISISGVTGAGSTLDTGNNVTLWQTYWDITGNDVFLNSIKFKEIGSIGNDAIQNFRLYVDNVQIGSSVQSLNLESGSSVLTFTLSDSQKRLLVGSKIVKLVGDIIGGQDRTFSFRAMTSDIKLFDAKYNTEVALASATFSAPQSAINSGSMTLTKTSDMPAGNISNGTDITLAKYVLKIYGENMGLGLGIEVGDAVSVGALSNISMYVDGVQVGNTLSRILGYGSSGIGNLGIVSRNESMVVEVKATINGSNGDNINIKVRAYGAGRFSLKYAEVVSNENILTINTQP